MLSAIGLDEAEERVYRLLVSLGAADLADVARRLNADETTTSGWLRGLEQHGLVAPSSTGSSTGSSIEADGRWVAAPPGVALRALLIQQRHELEQAELSAAQLAKEYRTEADLTSAHDLVEVVIGAAAVSHRFLQLQLGAQREVCSLVTATPVAVSGPENQAENAAVSRGVAYRIVLEREALSSPEHLAEVVEALARGVKVRVVDRVPTKLVVADQTLAMVPLSLQSSEPAALVIHADGLLESLTGLFDAVWRDATPLVLGGQGSGTVDELPTGPDRVDLQVMSLLLAGLTDAGIAKQLDIGTRTVQRRVQGLMQLAGVTTRLQLGWQAHARSWVTRS